MNNSHAASNQEDTWPSSPKSYLDSTIIIFFLSMAAYVGAYCFELGYLRWFGINYQSVRVQTESFVISFIILVPAVQSAHYWLRNLKDIRQEILKSRIAQNRIGRYWLNRLLSPSLLTILAYVILTSFILNVRFWLVVIEIAVFCLFELLDFNRKTPPLPNLFPKRIDRAIGLMMMSLLLIIASVSLGKLYASTVSIFKTVVIAKQRYIVVREYNGEFILKGIDSSNHLTWDTKFVPMEQLGGYTFQLQEIKKLRGGG